MKEWLWSLLKLLKSNENEPTRTPSIPKKAIELIKPENSHISPIRNTMKTSTNGISRIKKYESCVLKVYKDSAGLDTIGYGHLLTLADKSTSTFSGGISMEQAEALLVKDLSPAEIAVNKLVKVSLTQDQFDSLVSFVFNCGISALANSSLLRSINNKAPVSDIKNNFLKWDKIHDAKTGQLVISNGLHKRRLDESQAW